MPLLVALLLFHFPFDATRRGIPPPRRVLTTSTRQGGLVPSPSCSPILFDATRRGMPLLVAFLLLQHDGEGTSPPRRVLLSFLTQRGGAYPSSLRSCHLNTTGRVPALPVVFSFSF